ncbi:MAG: penicillin-binding protein 2 [Saprospiraceae bacterium]
MSDTHQGRQYVIMGLFGIVTLALILKLFQIQVLDSTYRAKADATAIDKLTLYPSRGLIYDRNGKLLVNNNPVYDLKVTYNQINENMDTLKFCQILGITKESFTKRLAKNWRSGRYSRSIPFVFLKSISIETYALFQESIYEFPGFFVEVRNVRGYPYRNAAHVLGYIKEVNQKEIERSSGSYTLGDYIGASGLELAYEEQLRGKKGAAYILKDNLGRHVGNYKGGNLDSAAISGKNLISSLDIDLQTYGEQLLQNKIGSIVAIEPSSGEILAMVSSPSYDPNLLTINRNRGKAYGELVNNPLKPLFDRSTMAEYPPGSLFKTVVGLVGMEEGVLDPSRTIRCNGGYTLNGQVLTGCHGHPTCTNVEQAIQHSCNAYFVTVFRDIVDKHGSFNPDQGLDMFNDYLYKFGIGRELDIDFPREKEGNYPTSSFYTKRFQPDKWKSVWIRSLGIGQGEMLMTNLQMANLAATVANRGFYYVPHFVKGFTDESVQLPEEYMAPNYVGIDAAHFQPIIDGMAAVVKNGTARRADISEIAICGKTGTAENPHGEDHSIFFAFAPKYNPQIAIAVYIENGGFGGTYAAPLASLMIEKYLTRKISQNRHYREKRILETDLMTKP